MCVESMSEVAALKEALIVSVSNATAKDTIIRQQAVTIGEKDAIIAEKDAIIRATTNLNNEIKGVMGFKQMYMRQGALTERSERKERHRLKREARSTLANSVWRAATREVALANQESELAFAKEYRARLNGGLWVKGASGWTWEHRN